MLTLGDYEQYTTLGLSQKPPDSEALECPYLLGPREWESLSQKHLFFVRLCPWANGDSLTRKKLGCVRSCNLRPLESINLRSSTRVFSSCVSRLQDLV